MGRRRQTGAGPRRVAPAGAVLAALVGACSSPSPAPLPDAARQRRVIDRPAGVVHALPPFEIRDDSVGPYRLGQPLATVLAGLPSGPRGVAVLDLPGVVRLSVIRAEDDKLLIGGEPMATTSFVAVLAGDVARTGSGLAVGSPLAELEKGYGAPVQTDGLIADPRLVTVAALPATRFLVQGGKVQAVVLTPPPVVPPAPKATGSAATAAADGSAAVTAARARPCAALPAPPPAARALVPEPAATWRTACLSTEPEYVVATTTELLVLAADGSRRVAGADIAGVAFFGVVPGDGRDELVVVRHEVIADRRRWLVSVWRVEAGKLVRVVEELVYEISASSAEWIGARLLELDLALEVTVRPDTMVVGGFLIDRSPPRVRGIVPLTPVTVARRRRPGGPDLAVSAAGSAAGSAALLDAAPADEADARDPGAPSGGHAGSSAGPSDRGSAAGDPAGDR